MGKIKSDLRVIAEPLYTWKTRAKDVMIQSSSERHDEGLIHWTKEVFKSAFSSK